MGQVCQKHQEFYESQCRWCEPVMQYPPIAAPAAPPSSPPPFVVSGAYPVFATYSHLSRTYIPLGATALIGWAQE